LKSCFSAGFDSHCSYFQPYPNPPKPAQTDPNRTYYTRPETKKVKKVFFILANDSGGEMNLSKKR